ncbi:hypothetical protein LJB84_00220 [Bacteroidales bacterium OttesenSCG-928-J19]|nr:hypothetical protein [Bacteroidales bacterium OttesenSCG-928-J19]
MKLNNDMNFKLVYSVVSTSDDIYLLQTYLSLYSAKYHMPNVRTTLVVDDLTKATLTKCRSRILDYVDELISVPLSQEYSKMVRSRLLKTNLRHYVKGDYLFVDSDTIVCGDLSELNSITAPLSAVWDRHCLLRDNPRYRNIKRRSKGIFDLEKEDFYFNSGVMLVRDCEESHRFYSAWHQNYLTHVDSIAIDQPTLALTHQQLNIPIHTLSGEYNCQIENGIRYIRGMKIMHYFASQPTKGNRSFLSKLQDPNLFKGVEQNGEIDDSLRNIVIRPELSLAECVCSYPVSPLFTTHLFSNLRDIFTHQENSFITKGMLGFLKVFVAGISKLN